MRGRTAAPNWAILRRTALNLAGRDQSSRASIRAKRKRAAWGDSNILQMLAS